MDGISTYILVFFLETICQLLSAMRIIYINNPKSWAASVICFFENGFFAVAMGAVITDVASDPTKALIYCIAFSAGVYLGARLEKRIASGCVSMEVLCPASDTGRLTQDLRAGSVRFFQAPSSGTAGDTGCLIFIKLPRKRQRRVEDLIKAASPGAAIAVRELEALSEGVS